MAGVSAPAPLALLHHGIVSMVRCRGRGATAPAGKGPFSDDRFLTSQFPTHPNREFFAALQGIKSGDQGSFRRDQGIPLSSAIWHSLLVTNPIVPTDLEPCREGEQRRR